MYGAHLRQWIRAPVVFSAITPLLTMVMATSTEPAPMVVQPSQYWYVIRDGRFHQPNPNVGKVMMAHGQLSPSRSGLQ